MTTLHCNSSWSFWFGPIPSKLHQADGRKELIITAVVPDGNVRAATLARFARWGFGERPDRRLELLEPGLCEVSRTAKRDTALGATFAPGAF